MSDDVPGPFRTEPRIALIAESFARLLGRPLAPPANAPSPALALWNAPLAIVAHGIEDDPLFFFGNRAALRRFETTVEQFLGMPSRHSAEAPLREERQALLERVTRDGYIDDYAGMRISARGTRFAIRDAIVWNLIDAQGRRHGQAAAFAV